MQKHILTVPHDILRKKSVNVSLTKDIITFVSDLEETLIKKDNPKGVGLSAPQVGKNYNIFSTYIPYDIDDPDDKPILYTFINPVILDHSKETTFGNDLNDPMLEGCLSIPSLYGPVPRYEWIMIGYTNPKGEHIEKKFDDFHARVIQHEYDHLHGILFTDYIYNFNLPLYESRKNKLVEIDNKIVKAF